MPCTYTAIDLKAKERERERDKEKEAERKRKVLLLILSEMGFTDIKEENLAGNNIMITADDGE